MCHKSGALSTHLALNRKHKDNVFVQPFGLPLRRSVHMHRYCVRISVVYIKRCSKSNIQTALCVICNINIEIKQLIKLYNSFRYILDIFDFSML